ncbi:hypothetical protein [Streptomyces sp. NPDC006510]
MSTFSGRAANRVRALPPRRADFAAPRRDLPAGPAVALVAPEVSGS